ncbi:MATE family efflux transporter [Caproiciproducens sp. AGMB10547]|uniref:Multidrug export protein MepA n=2 Tax=Caproiciproducens faecalis TaxID=2820301 RepID=A0ABS7DNA5_9FIRM|nr:MATE family efflux transporter [Caproiciproducens faecalis]
MKEGSVKKALAVLGLPTIIGLMVTGLYNFVDSFFVAQLGTLPMSAISIVYPLVTLVPGIALLFGNGGAAFISELLGAGEKEKADIVLSSTLFYCFLASVASLGLLFFLNPLLKLMGASPAVLPIASDYAFIIILSFLFQIPSICLMNLVRAEGAVMLSTASQLGGSILNIILDPIFIWPLGMGVRGAAIATGISQFVSFTILIPFYLLKKSYLNLSLKNIRFEWWIIRPIWKVGFPIFTINLFQSLSISAMNVAAAAYGDFAVAGIGIVNRLIGISTFAITGFSRGYQTLTAFNYGAKNFHRIRLANKTAYEWAVLFGVLVSALQIFFAKNLVGLFSTDSQVVAVGMQALFANSLLFFLYGFEAIATVYLLCIRHETAGFVLSIGRQGLFFLPILFAASRFFGLTGIYYSQAAADLVTTAAALIILHKIRHTEQNTVRAAL